MDMTIKLIPVFFVLILLANYFNFTGFFFILKTLPCMEGRTLRKRTKIYFVAMNCLYLGVLVTACFPDFYPVCTDEKAYPVVMNFASMLFIVNYLFHFVINCNKEKALQRFTESNIDHSNVEEEEAAELKLVKEWNSKTRS